MSAELVSKEKGEDGDYKRQLKALQTQFVKTLSQADHFLAGVEQLDTQLLHLVNATGAVVCGGNRCICVGDRAPNTTLPLRRLRRSPVRC